MSTESLARKMEMGTEAVATLQVLDMAFSGYPLPEKFATKEEAVTLLGALWDIVDNYDGSGVNIEWAAGRKLPEGGVAAWARRKPLDPASSDVSSGKDEK